MAANIGQVTFWINAFIPRNVAGVTEEIKTGLNRGKTALPLPWYANAALYNLIEKPKGTAYLTDQRGFSDDMKTSVRIQSAAAVTLHPYPKLFSPFVVTSGTREVNINTGETQGESVADLSDCSIDGIFDAVSGGGLYQYKKSTDERLNQLFSLLDQVAKAGQTDDRSTSFLMDMYSMSDGHHWHPTTMREGNDRFAMKVKVVGAASDPLVGSAANIDYKLHFIVGSDPTNSRVLVGVLGLLDGFPAFEAYARYNNTTKALFQVGVPTGHTPFDLLGDADATIVGAVTF